MNKVLKQSIINGRIEIVCILLARIYICSVVIGFFFFFLIFFNLYIYIFFTELMDSYNRGAAGPPKTGARALPPHLPRAGRGNQSWLTGPLSADTCQVKKVNPLRQGQGRHPAPL